MIRTIVDWDLYWGLIILGSYHKRAKPRVENVTKGTPPHIFWQLLIEVPQPLTFNIPIKVYCIGNMSNIVVEGVLVSGVRDYEHLIVEDHRSNEQGLPANPDSLAKNCI